MKNPTKTTTSSKSPEALAQAFNQTQLKNYLDALSPEQRKFVKTLRDTIVAAAPGATDSFGYGTPEVVLKGRTLFTYVAMIRHAKLSPLPAGVPPAELEGFRTSKDGIQFPYNKPLPKELIKRLVKARVAEK